MTTESKRARRGRNEASIFFREDKALWVGILSLGFDADGKRRRRTIYGSTKQEVQEEIRKLQNQAASGGIPKAGMMTVAQLLDHWLEAMRPSWANGTHASHAQLVRNHPRPTVGGVRLKNLLALHVSNAMQEMHSKGVSDPMRRHALVTLRAALAYAVRMKLLTFNAASPVPLPAKSMHKSEGLSLEQVAVFIEAARSDRLAALYLLALDSGLRQGELLALTWRDIDAERGTVRVNKTLEEVNGNLAIKAPKTKSSIRTVKVFDSDS